MYKWYKQFWQSFRIVQNVCFFFNIPLIENAINMFSINANSQNRNNMVIMSLMLIVQILQNVLEILNKYKMKFLYFKFIPITTTILFYIYFLKLL